MILALFILNKFLFDIGDIVHSAYKVLFLNSSRLFKCNYNFK